MPCNYIEKHSNIFIHSLNKLTDQVTAMKNKQMIAKVGKFQAKKTPNHKHNTLKMKIYSDAYFTCQNTGSRNPFIRKCVNYYYLGNKVLPKTFLYDLNHPLHLSLPFGLTPSVCFFYSFGFTNLFFCCWWVFFVFQTNKLWFYHKHQKSKEFRVKYQGSSL